MAQSQTAAADEPSETTARDDLIAALEDMSEVHNVIDSRASDRVIAVFWKRSAPRKFFRTADDHGFNIVYHHHTERSATFGLE